MDPFEPIQLNSKRLVLRHFVESDLLALFSIFSNPEVMRYWSSPPMTDISDARHMLLYIQENYRNRSALQLAIERKNDQALIGTCTFHNLHLKSRRAEIGYALGRMYWGQGYMREALTVLIDFAFESLGLNRLEADIDPRNTSSEILLERLGFLKEGYLRQRWIVNGEVSDTVFYGLLRSDWLNIPVQGVCFILLQRG
jgi:ribosomal-protein-alanine N-acetyltransferase